MNSRSHSSLPLAPPRRKAVLFCPECGHQSPPDGDWGYRRTAAETVYTCPECRTEVVRQPIENDGPLPSVFTTTSRLLNAMWDDYRHQIATWMRP